MPTCEHIALFAQYNATMNRLLYDAAASLPEDAGRADRGAFFGSLLGTMNHLLAGDTIWLTRFAGHPAALAPLRGAPPPRGQASTLLTQAGVDIGVTDLLAWIPEPPPP